MKLSAIAQAIGSAWPQTQSGDPEITRVSSPQSADSSSIIFLSDPRYTEKTIASAASAVIVKKGVDLPGKICLPVDDPYAGYARAAQLFENTQPLFGAGIHATAAIDPSAGVHSTAHIGPYAVIGRDAIIGAHTVISAHVVIEPNAIIGENCRIDSNATIRRQCTVGNRVIIESGTVIGSEGFGNARLHNGEWVRIPSFGTVVIEDDVWIGAQCAIDRGALDETRICIGARLDNLVHIAHNVVVGDQTAMAAQAGVSGSTTIGKRVIIAGQAGFVGHIRIGDDAFIGAKAGISKDVPAATKVTGYPAREFMTMRRIEATMGELPSIISDLKKMVKEFRDTKAQRH